LVNTHLLDTSSAGTRYTLVTFLTTFRLAATGLTWPT
jgi:hypothetical protein